MRPVRAAACCSAGLSTLLLAATCAAQSPGPGVVPRAVSTAPAAPAATAPAATAPAPRAAPPPAPRPAAAQGSADAPPDLRALFTTGALSPGFAQRNATSTAPYLGSGGGGSGGRVRDGSPTFFSLQINPALFAFGVWAGRIELALVPYVSVMAEGIRVSEFEVDAPSSLMVEGNLHISGYVLDLGLHLWPGGEGARGFYFGPRFFFGGGSDRDDLGEGKVRGWGGDLGYQWVAGVFSFNLGAGLGRGTVTVTPSDKVKANPLLTEDQRNTEVSAAFWRPYLTVGVGVAF